MAEEAWDVVIFADCVMSGDGGEKLPLALCELLRGRPGAIAVGVFPPDLRTGVDAFWRQAEAAGLEWEAQEVEGPEAADPRWGRLYVFRRPPGRVRAWWGEASADEELAVAPLFEDVL